MDTQPPPVPGPGPDKSEMTWFDAMEKRIEERERQFRLLTYGVYVAAGCIVATLCTAAILVVPSLPSPERICDTHLHAIIARLRYESSRLQEKKQDRNRIQSGHEIRANFLRDSRKQISAMSVRTNLTEQEKRELSELKARVAAQDQLQSEDATSLTNLEKDIEERRDMIKTLELQQKPLNC